MNIASLLATLGIDTSGFTKGMGGAKDSLTGFGKSLLGQVIGITSLATAVGMAGKAVVNSVTDWATYADGMRMSAQLTGTTTEEMSRLVQAADDYRVPVDKMTNAMELALKNGFVPTIDNIAALSDVLLATEDPAARATMAAGIFGKSYADVMPFLLAGSEAIKGATAAIADNLAVTKEGALVAKDFVDSADAVGDSWAGAKNELGQAIAPTAIAGMKAITDSFSDAERFKAVGVLNKDLKELGLNVSELTEPYEGFFGGITKTDDALLHNLTTVKDWATTTYDSFIKTGMGADEAKAKVVTMFNEQGAILVLATENVAEANMKMTGAYDDMINASISGGAQSAAAAAAAAAEWDTYVAAVGNVTSLEANFSSIIGLAKTYDEILYDIAYNAKDRDRLMADGFSETSDEIKALDDSTLALQGQMTNLANQMTLDMYQGAIAIGGITRAEADSYFQMASDMGIISQGAADAAIDAYDRAVKTVNGMTIDDKKAAIELDPAGALATIKMVEALKIATLYGNIEMTVAYYDPGGYNYDLNDRPGGATGGEITHGGLITVGERGPELVYLPDNAQIIPNSRTDETIKGLAGNGGNVYNLTMYTSSNPADVRTAFELMEVWA